MLTIPSKSANLPGGREGRVVRHWVGRAAGLAQLPAVPRRSTTPLAPQDSRQLRTDTADGHRARIASVEDGCHRHYCPGARRMQAMRKDTTSNAATGNVIGNDRQQGPPGRLGNGWAGPTLCQQRDGHRRPAGMVEVAGSGSRPSGVRTHRRLRTPAGGGPAGRRSAGPSGPSQPGPSQSGARLRAGPRTTGQDRPGWTPRRWARYGAAFDGPEPLPPEPAD